MYKIEQVIIFNVLHLTNFFSQIVNSISYRFVFPVGGRGGEILPNTSRHWYGGQNIFQTKQIFPTNRFRLPKSFRDPKFLLH